MNIVDILEDHNGETMRLGTLRHYDVERGDKNGLGCLVSVGAIILTIVALIAWRVGYSQGWAAHKAESERGWHAL